MTDDAPRPGPLAGITVLELGTTIMAPSAGQILGDLGADVIKIEGPDGDPSRAMALGAHPGLSGTAINLHRNKRSIALDLKSAGGREVALRLIARADVLVTNFRLSALERLGLDHAALAAEHPRLVYVEAHGYALDSGRGEEPAYDDTVQSAIGLPRLAERAGAGVSFAPTLIADKVAGLGMVQAVLAALVSRAATGLGQRVEVPMFDTALAFVAVEHLALAAFPGGEAGHDRILTPHRGPHRTADGWLTVMPYLDRHWRAIYEESGRTELLDGPSHADMATRMRDADIVYAELKTLIAERPTAEWWEICRRRDVPVAAVPSLDEVVADPALHGGAVRELEHPVAGTYRSVRQPYRFSGTPTAETPRPAPQVGADAAELLAELGIDAAEAEALLASGAVIRPI